MLLVTTKHPKQNTWLEAPYILPFGAGGGGWGPTKWPDLGSAETQGTAAPGSRQA